MMGGRATARLYALAWFCLGSVLSTYVLWVSWDSEHDSADSGSKLLSKVAMRAVASAAKRPRVVVSFTTFPLGQRMAAVKKVLASLANQTWRPDSVIINFPDHIARLSKEKLGIPPEAYEWKKEFSFLRIHETQDYGPATKLLGALEIETDPDTIIVIVDDDTYYHRDTVLALVSTLLASPVDLCPCFTCEVVSRRLLGRTEWKYAGEEGECRGFASGFAAYAVRPRYFDHTLWDFSLGPAGCRLHDDVWISGRMLVGSGVRPYVVRPGFSSTIGEFIQEAGHRQAESVFVAQRAALRKGQDPQMECVESFPFLTPSMGRHAL